MRVWLVWSNQHGAWWRPNRSGYTLDVAAAGRYALSDALQCAAARSRCPDGVPPEVIVPSPELIAAFLGGREARG